GQAVRPEVEEALPRGKGGMLLVGHAHVRPPKTCACLTGRTCVCLTRGTCACPTIFNGIGNGIPNSPVPDWPSVLAPLRTLGLFMFFCRRRDQPSLIFFPDELRPAREAL